MGPPGVPGGPIALSVPPGMGKHPVAHPNGG